MNSKCVEYFEIKGDGLFVHKQYRTKTLVSFLKFHCSLHDVKELGNPETQRFSVSFDKVKVEGCHKYRNTIAY